MDEPKIKGRRYDWLNHFNQKKFTLVKGKDYAGTTTYFSQYVRRAAKRHGYLISIDVGEGQIVVEVVDQVIPKPEVHTNKYRRGKQ